MSTLFLVITIVFLISVPVLVAFAVFELSPFAQHEDHYRDASGKRRFESPRLD